MKQNCPFYEMSRAMDDLAQPRSAPAKRSVHNSKRSAAKRAGTTFGKVVDAVSRERNLEKLAANRERRRKAALRTQGAL